MFLRNFLIYLQENELPQLKLCDQKYSLPSVTFAVSWGHHGKWTDPVTYTLILEPCCLLSDCRPVTLVDEVSITWPLVLEPCCLHSDCLWLMKRRRHLFHGLITMSFSVWQSSCYTEWWTDSVIWSLVLEKFFVLVVARDEQILSLSPWSWDHVACCLTFSFSRQYHMVLRLV